MRCVAKRRIGMLDRDSSIEIESSRDAIRRESRKRNPPGDQIYVCNLGFSAAC